MPQKIPFQEETKEGYFIRTFTSEVNPEDLKWHIDEEDRIIEPIEKTDWLFQFDNQLPFSIDSKIEIKKGTWHRIIKGTGELVLKIVKY